MTKTSARVQEASKLAKSADGTYRVRLIQEGQGSTGIYGAELLSNSAHVFENAPSFINHPVDPTKPHERDLNSIAGRVTGVAVETDDEGKTSLFGTYKPRAEYVPLFEQFADIIGLSIFCKASGEMQDDGRLLVESFSDDDPYRSVDAVVAAGRGGRFERAQESLRAIESSLGTPQSNKPGSTSAPESTTQEARMDPKDLEAIGTIIAEALKPVTTYFANEAARRQAEADAAAQGETKEAAVEAAVAAVEAVKAAKLLPSLETPLVEAAKRGEDVTAGIESAKKVMTEASEAAKGAASEGYVHTPTGGESHDWSIARLGGN